MNPAGILDLGQDPDILIRTVIVIALVFGFFPNLGLHLIVAFYPRDHVRRRQLLGDYESVSTYRRPVYVAAQLGTALVEVPTLRWYQLHALASRRRPDAWSWLQHIGAVVVTSSIASSVSAALMTNRMFGDFVGSRANLTFAVSGQLVVTSLAVAVLFRVVKVWRRETADRKRL